MARRRGRLRVMVDATVLVAGSGWPRWPYEVLQAGLRGEFQLAISPYVLRQVRRVLQQQFPPEHLQRFEAFLALDPFEIVGEAGPAKEADNIGLVRDETDVPIALAAINAGVDCIVSEEVGAVRELPLRVGGRNWEDL